tara:strand:- start:1467 stop:1733 length:267 start_codon:yes stop_codon:yes gene_type:complete
MNRKVDQSTLNTVLVATLGVMTTIAGFGVISMTSTVKEGVEDAKQMSISYQVKSDQKHEAVMSVMLALENRLIVLETKETMRTKGLSR